MNETLLEAVNNNLKQVKFSCRPFNHWIFNKIFTVKIADNLSDIPLRPSRIEQHYGRRESYNSSRVFLNADTCKTYPIFRNVVNVFSNQEIIKQIENICGVNLSHGKLRVEYTLDSGDFWLEPHRDIKEKLLTFIVYLSTNPSSDTWGTVLFDRDLNPYCRMPYKLNFGFMFIPGDDTWHGFPKQEIRNVRKSLIINYVTEDWQNIHELAIS